MNRNSDNNKTEKFSFRKKISNKLLAKMKIKDKIIFGFIIVAIILGLVSYFSNKPIIEEFRKANSLSYLLNNVSFEQKKLELFVDDYLATDKIEELSDYDFVVDKKNVEKYSENFRAEAEKNADKKTILDYNSQNENFIVLSSELIDLHKKELKAKKDYSEYSANEKEERKRLTDIVKNDLPLYNDFLYLELKNNEITSQYQQDDTSLKEWNSAFDVFKRRALESQINIPELEKDNEIFLNMHKTALGINEIEKKERGKLEEFKALSGRLYATQDQIYKEIINEKIKYADNAAIIFIFIILFVIIFQVISLSYIVSSLISKPISKLVNFISIANDGNFGKRIEVDSDDEIGLVAKSFNSLLDKVEESRAILEVKVEARTKRLKDLSENLESKIEEKTKELNEKIAQLERFNELAVGRELRMVELKREFSILEEGKKYENEKSKKSRNKSKKNNCWDYWNCKKETRDKCPAYLTNLGKECWVVSAGKCPRSRERGIEECRDCEWYKKMHAKSNFKEK